MPQFLATISRGLHKALLDEMTEKNFQDLKKTPAGVEFSGPWKECYRANMVLKITPRILKPILNFSAYNKDDFYNNAKKHDFTKYIKPNHTIFINSSASSHVFRDQRYVSMLMKDVIADQFKEKYGERPSVSKENPKLSIYVKVFNNEVSISLDTTGSSLSQRGYRLETVEAPIKEHLAAGVLKLMNWQEGEAIYDPMCGSGTILIEAGLFNRINDVRKYGFERWLTFQSEIFEELKLELQNLNTSLNTNQKAATTNILVKKKSKKILFASDINPKNLEVADICIRASKLEQKIQLFQLDFFDLNIGLLEKKLGHEVPEKGLLLMNPPYDYRLKTKTSLIEFYDKIINKAKDQFPSWRLGILAPQDFDHLTLSNKPDSIANFESGGFKVKLMRYPNLKVARP